MPRRLLALAVLALALAACGQTGTSTADFKGEERRVAQVVADLQEASQGNDPEEICSRLLAPDLVRSFEEGGRTCTQEIGDALDDADEFTMEIERVTISGISATARVEDYRDKPRELRLTREGGRGWRISSLG